MKIFKGILGLIFLLSFFYQLLNIFSTPPVSSTNPEEFALRVGTSMAVSLVIGIYLLRSAFKKKPKSEHESEIAEEKIVKNYSKFKKAGLVGIILVLILSAFIFGRNTSDKGEEYLKGKEISDSNPFYECLKRAESLGENPYKKVVMDECYRRSINGK